MTIYMAIYGHIWAYMAIYGPYIVHIWSYMATYIYIYIYMATYAHIWPYDMVIYGHMFGGSTPSDSDFLVRKEK